MKNLKFTHKLIIYITSLVFLTFILVLQGKISVQSSLFRTAGICQKYFPSKTLRKRTLSFLFAFLFCSLEILKNSVPETKITLQIKKEKKEKPLGFHVESIRDC